MRTNYFKPILLGLSLFSISVLAQEKPKYDYQEAFKPFFYQNNGTETRSASGKPGHNYWQNRADYNLDISLNDQTNELIGTSEITYTNNSFDELEFLWLQLDQNLFKKDSRGSALVPLAGSRYGESGISLMAVIKLNQFRLMARMRITQFRIRACKLIWLIT